MQDYIDWKKSTTRNPKSVDNYARWAKRYTQFLKGEDITLESIGRFKLFLKNEMEYSPKNIQYGLNIIRDFISYQIAVHGLIFPLALLKIPQERSNSHPAITKEEFDRMASQLSRNEPMGLQRLLMITMLWDTGMRAGELLRLKIKDLKPQGAIIHNEKNHRNRRIGWSKETEDLLRFYLPLRRHLITDEEWLFVSFRWKPHRQMTSRQLERIVEELRNDAGLENTIRPHSFRHGFVHRKLNEGKPITTVAQMLGHASTINVLTYAQLSSKEMIEAWEM